MVVVSTCFLKKLAQQYFCVAHKALKEQKNREWYSTRTGPAVLPEFLVYQQHPCHTSVRTTIYESVYRFSHLVPKSKPTPRFGRRKFSPIMALVLQQGRHRRYLERELELVLRVLALGRGSILHTCIQVFLKGNDHRCCCGAPPAGTKATLSLIVASSENNVAAVHGLLNQILNITSIAPWKHFWSLDSLFAVRCHMFDPVSPCDWTGLSHL